VIRIVEAEIRHVGMLAARMLPGDSLRLSLLGRDPRRTIRAHFRDSSYRRAALLDDEPIAIWGVTGPLAASTGTLWLYLSERAKHRPLTVIREARRELTLMMETRHEIVCYLHDDDPTAKRFAEFFGFEIGAPVPIAGTGMVGYRGVLSCPF
jgi:hypothetical protein